MKKWRNKKETKTAPKVKAKTTATRISKKASELSRITTKKAATGVTAKTATKVMAKTTASRVTTKKTATKVTAKTAALRITTAKKF